MPKVSASRQRKSRSVSAELYEERPRRVAGVEDVGLVGLLPEFLQQPRQHVLDGAGAWIGRRHEGAAAPRVCRQRQRWHQLCPVVDREPGVAHAPHIGQPREHAAPAPCAGSSGHAAGPPIGDVVGGADHRGRVQPGLGREEVQRDPPGPPDPFLRDQAHAAPPARGLRPGHRRRQRRHHRRAGHASPPCMISLVPGGVAASRVCQRSLQASCRGAAPRPWLQARHHSVATRVRYCPTIALR